MPRAMCPSLEHFGFSEYVERGPKLIYINFFSNIFEMPFKCFSSLLMFERGFDKKG